MCIILCMLCIVWMFNVYCVVYYIMYAVYCMDV